MFRWVFVRVDEWVGTVVVIIVMQSEVFVNVAPVLMLAVEPQTRVLILDVRATDQILVGYQERPAGTEFVSAVSTTVVKEN